MNHQDFVLVARDFLDAFTGCHVKRLRTGLPFIFAITLFTSSMSAVPDRIREVWYRRAMKCHNSSVHVLSPVGYSFSLPVEKRSGVLILKVILHLFPELSRLPFPVANEDRADTSSTQLLMVQEIRIGILRLSRFKEIKIQGTSVVA